MLNQTEECLKLKKAPQNRFCDAFGFANVRKNMRL
jgi:hypothetical protein